LNGNDPISFSRIDKFHANLLKGIWNQLFMTLYKDLDLLVPGDHKQKYVICHNLSKMIGTTYSRNCIFEHFESKVSETQQLFRLPTIELYCHPKRESDRFGLSELLEDLKPIPNELNLLTQLVDIRIVDKIITSTIDGLINLKHLEIFFCDMTSCLGIKNFPKLENLTISSCHIKKIPQFVFSLPKLSYLNVSHNPITDLPKRILDMTTLSTLNIVGTKIKRNNILDLLHTRLVVHS
jgi:Leucine-rich repeat (LRR) protein